MAAKKFYRISNRNGMHMTGKFETRQEAEAEVARLDAEDARCVAQSWCTASWGYNIIYTNQRVW